MTPEAVADIELNFDEIFEGDSNPIFRLLLIFAKNIYTDRSASQARIFSGSSWIFWVTCRWSYMRVRMQRPGPDGMSTLNE